MKTIFTAIITVLVSVASLNASANPTDNNKKNSPSSLVITNYLAAISLGDFETNKLSFAKDFEYHNADQDRKFNRKQYTDFLKKTKNLRYDCKTSYNIMDETNKTCIAKVTMEFDNFTRIDYITLCCQGEDWQISKVVTTYP